MNRYVVLSVIMILGGVACGRRSGAENAGRQALGQPRLEFASSAEVIARVKANQRPLSGGGDSLQFSSVERVQLIHGEVDVEFVEARAPRASDAVWYEAVGLAPGKAVLLNSVTAMDSLLSNSWPTSSREILRTCGLAARIREARPALQAEDGLVSRAGTLPANAIWPRNLPLRRLDGPVYGKIGDRAANVTFWFVGSGQATRYACTLSRSVASGGAHLELSPVDSIRGVGFVRLGS